MNRDPPQCKDLIKTDDIKINNNETNLIKLYSNPDLNKTDENNLQQNENDVNNPIELIQTEATIPVLTEILASQRKDNEFSSEVASELSTAKIMNDNLDLADGKARESLNNLIEEKCSDSFDMNLNNCNPIQDVSISGGGDGEHMICRKNSSNDASSLNIRRVSFPKNDSQLVTGYLEPANPWESASSVKDIQELTQIYISSCEKHHTKPIELIIQHLKSLDLTINYRQPKFSLKNYPLTPNDCETLEEIFKRVQYELLDFSSCNLNEISGSSLFDIIEYYEAATELDISDNPDILNRGWTCCVQMVKRSHALQILTACFIPVSEHNATSLGTSLNGSSLHTIKLEHCGLRGKPIVGLCNGLKKNTVLKELYLAFNDLYEKDAENLAKLLECNAHIQFLDISNNNILDAGVKHLAVALMKQSSHIDLYSKDFDDSLGSTTRNGNNNIINNGKPILSGLDLAPQQLNVSNGRSMLDALLRIQPKCDPEIVVSPTSPDDEIKAILLEANSADNNFSDNGSTPSTEYDVSSDNEKTLTNSSNASVTSISNQFPVESTAKELTKKLLQAQNLLSSSSCSSILSDDLESAHSVDSAFYESSSEGKFIAPATPPPINKPEQLSRLAFDKISAEIRGNRLPDSLSLLQKVSSPALVTDRLRSHSSDSLSSDTSFDGCETAFSKNVRENLTKNDTLTRQKPLSNETQVINNNKPRGLRALILWNNNITRESSEVIGDLFAVTKSLELLNIGKNCISNEFVSKVKDKLRLNSTLKHLGLQSAHLSCEGIRDLASILQFGGNCTLQRIDIRDNHIQIDCLNILMDALKSNKSVTRIDIDDVPKRIPDSSADFQFNYSRALHQVRSLCSHNEKQQMQQLLDSLSSNTNSGKKCENPKLRYGYLNSRKISLTCQSIINPINVLEQRSTVNNNTNNKLDIKRKSGIRLRSPLPSPPTISPSTSPVPSPLKSRFQVFKVSEDLFSQNNTNSLLNNNRMGKKITPIARKSRFHVTKVKDEVTNYHSLDASNNINCSDLQQQNFIKSKSLPDFSKEQINISEESDENSRTIVEILEPKESLAQTKNSGELDTATNQFIEKSNDSLGDSGILCEDSKIEFDNSETDDSQSEMNKLSQNYPSDEKSDNSNLLVINTDEIDINKSNIMIDSEAALEANVIKYSNSSDTCTQENTCSKLDNLSETKLEANGNNALNESEVEGNKNSNYNIQFPESTNTSNYSDNFLFKIDEIKEQIQQINEINNSALQSINQIDLSLFKIKTQMENAERIHNESSVIKPNVNLPVYEETVEHKDGENLNLLSEANVDEIQKHTVVEFNKNELKSETLQSEFQDECDTSVNNHNLNEKSSLQEPVTICDEDLVLKNNNCEEIEKYTEIEKNEEKEGSVWYDEIKSVSNENSSIQKLPQIKENSNNETNESLPSTSAPENFKSTQTQNKSAVDKLLSIFQNPVDIFSTRNHQHVMNHSTINYQKKLSTVMPQNDRQLIRKHSPPNIFSWLKPENKGNNELCQQSSNCSSTMFVQKFQNPSELSSIDNTKLLPSNTNISNESAISTNRQTASFFGVASKQFKDFTEYGKQMFFKQTMNSEVPSNLSNLENKEVSVSFPNSKNITVESDNDEISENFVVIETDKTQPEMIDILNKNLVELKAESKHQEQKKNILVVAESIKEAPDCESIENEILCVVIKPNDKIEVVEDSVDYENQSPNTENQNQGHNLTLEIFNKTYDSQISTSQILSPHCTCDDNGDADNIDDGAGNDNSKLNLNILIT